MYIFFSHPVINKTQKLAIFHIWYLTSSLIRSAHIKNKNEVFLLSSFHSVFYNTINHHDNRIQFEISSSQFMNAKNIWVVYMETNTFLDSRKWGPVR